MNEWISEYMYHYEYITNEYLNIFALEKINKYLAKWIYSSKYIRICLNIQIFVPHWVRYIHVNSGNKTATCVKIVRVTAVGVTTVRTPVF